MQRHLAEPSPVRAAIGRQIAAWSTSFAIIPTVPTQLAAAARLAERRRKQFWDMVIVAVAANSGATILLTEDVGDREIVAGVRIVDPFDPANAATIREGRIPPWPQAALRRAAPHCAAPRT